jgi:hypothetical protein
LLRPAWTGPVGIIFAGFSALWSFTSFFVESDLRCSQLEEETLILVFSVVRELRRGFGVRMWALRSRTVHLLTLYLPGMHPAARTLLPSLQSYRCQGALPPNIDGSL